MKRRVVIYSGHCEIVGGDAKYLFELLEHLDRTRFDVSVFTDLNPAFKGRAAKLLGTADSITYLSTRPRLFPRSRVEEWYRSIQRRQASQPWSRPLFRALSHRWRGREVYRYVRRAAWAAGDWLRGGPPADALQNARIFLRIFGAAGRVDVFHFNNGGYPAKRAGLLALVIARWAGVQTVLMTCHSLAEPRRGFGLWDRLLDWAVARSCTLVIAASEAGRQGLIHLRGFPPGKVRTIYCGLEDVEPASRERVGALRASLGLTDSTLALLMVGNLDWEGKGFEPMFRALAHVRTRLPDVRLLLAGDGEPARRADLERLVEQLGLQGAVQFLGFRTDIADLNAAADIAVAPATGFEATPYTVKEAARAARPIITTSRGGCPEGVEDSVTGIIVPPGDPEALAEAVWALAADPALRTRMGVAGRRLFHARFLLADKIREHEDLYVGSMGGGERQPAAATTRSFP